MMEQQHAQRDHRADVTEEAAPDDRALAQAGDLLCCSIVTISSAGGTGVESEPPQGQFSSRSWGSSTGGDVGEEA